MLPSAVKRLLLFIGNGAKSDIEILLSFEITESQLLNLLTQKQYKDLFQAVHQPSCSVISLTGLGKSMRKDVLAEMERERRARLHALRGWITTAIAVAAFIKAFFF